jgi:hypothetical protein
LIFNKAGDPEFPDVFQIIPRAHMVIIFVSVVHTVDLSAWILAAFMTKGGVPFRRAVYSCAFLE